VHQEYYKHDLTPDLFRQKKKKKPSFFSSLDYQLFYLPIRLKICSLNRLFEHGHVIRYPME